MKTEDSLCQRSRAAPAFPSAPDSLPIVSPSSSLLGRLCHRRINRALLLERGHENGLAFVPSTDPQLRGIDGQALRRLAGDARHAGGLAVLGVVDLGGFEQLRLRADHETSPASETLR